MIRFCVGYTLTLLLYCVVISFRFNSRYFNKKSVIADKNLEESRERILWRCSPLHLPPRRQSWTGIITRDVIAPPRRSRNISYRHWWSAVRRCRRQSTPVPTVSAAYRPPIIARVGRRVLRSHWSAPTTIALPERGNVALAVSSSRRVSVSVR